MAKVEIYTKGWCPFCGLAKRHLASKAIRFEEIDVTNDVRRESEMVNRSGRTSVPQIFVNDRHIGGSDDLQRADTSGALDALLANTGEKA